MRAASHTSSYRIDVIHYINAVEMAVAVMLKCYRGESICKSAKVLADCCPGYAIRTEDTNKYFIRASHTNRALCLHGKIIGRHRCVCLDA